MALALTHLSWWLWSGKQQEPNISDGSPLNSSPDSGLWEMDKVKFPVVHRKAIGSSSGRVKKKWQSREERRIDKEYDVVLVPSDGGCLSASDSDGSDWSVGWLEPHGPGFKTDDTVDDSFAVLVRCYGHDQKDLVDNSKDVFIDTIGKISDINASENKKHMEQWVSSLQNN
ncbi:uncharacterized protein LOC111387360 [Olea europaea var. sylvestris]|uniref:Mediator of RNA polymerase II transcription subunit 22a n=1 Tax=Olea europaea subsp. europaea TaxID=158383 RepID=A0A8S0QGW3_OLEEU|nr:uncharacterized protein LOC111387360 [Olea europaea var. sylvestris]XP_022867684.1 uncharacterized protein LOC111387360 [Olea europaea var. sylvestris]CAA2966371.1 Mediator of RNA polymerase II transcription subunit 22a [Olea europaea subsp. europaea]